MAQIRHRHPVVLRLGRAQPRLRVPRRVPCRVAVRPGVGPRPARRRVDPLGRPPAARRPRRLDRRALRRHRGLGRRPRARRRPGPARRGRPARGRRGRRHLERSRRRRHPQPVRSPARRPAVARGRTTPGRGRAPAARAGDGVGRARRGDPLHGRRLRRRTGLAPPSVHERGVRARLLRRVARGQPPLVLDAAVRQPGQGPGAPGPRRPRLSREPRRPFVRSGRRAAPLGHRFGLPPRPAAHDRSLPLYATNGTTRHAIRWRVVEYVAA
ncbi:hypothetical protein FRIGORI9N_450061 [Frigoribacterium sp. 9N]|nr:hypothetical protein FRIGORI9N_450061 [Frigoribacterium sp. 9N]